MKKVLKQISNISGIIILFIDLAFTIWTSIDKFWYNYIINFILLYLASSIINTSYIQGLTRGYSYIYLYKFKGIGKALGVNILTIILMTIAYLISYYVFSFSNQIIHFFITCFILSTIVAIADNQFLISIERTKSFEEGNIMNNNINE